MAGSLPGLRPLEHLPSLTRRPPLWQEWAAVLLDLLFPPFCPLCHVRLGEGRRDPLCGSCWERLERLLPPYCARCGRPLPTFEGSGSPEHSPCEPCRRRRPLFAYARAATLYGGRVREALHSLKFQGKTAMARPLGDLMAEAGGAMVPVEEVDCLVPVPLHPSREAERGFNQSWLLARRVGRRWGVPVESRALRRRRSTRPQTDLDVEERRSNVRGVFSVSRPEAFSRRHVLLIDDVFTTGATVSECARVLLAAGAATVGVLTVARVP